MKTCKDCEKEISKSAKICPGCGAKIKKSLPKKIIGLTMFVIGIIIIANALGNKEAIEDNKKTYEQNEIAIHKNVNYSIIETKRSKGEKHFEPKSGYEYIIITIKIENKSDKKISYNALDWKISDSTGDEYSYTIWGNNTDTSLSSGDLNPNGIKTGSISFEVPKDDSSLILKYYTSILSSEKAFEFKIK